MPAPSCAAAAAASPRSSGRSSNDRTGRVNYGDARALPLSRMTMLRVLLAAAPAADRAEAWALFDAAGTCVRTGRDRPAAWPKADRVEFVLAAAQVRVARVTLPPLPASRVADAARFALEDQLAGPDGAHHIAVSAQATDGGVRVVVVARSLLAGIAGSDAWRRADPRRAGSRASRRGLDLVRARRRTPRASSAAPTAALSRSTRRRPTARCRPSWPWRWRRPAAADRRLHAVRVDAPFAASSLARWQRETGVDFQPRHVPGAGKPHRPPRLRMPSICCRRRRALRPRRARDPARLFAPALCAGRRRALPPRRRHRRRMGVAALRRMARRARMDRPCRRQPASRRTPRRPPSAARAALARRYAALRHAQGLPAPDDALPLLARATPALAALPAGCREERHLRGRALDARPRFARTPRRSPISTPGCGRPACLRWSRHRPPGRASGSAGRDGDHRSGSFRVPAPVATLAGDKVARRTPHRGGDPAARRGSPSCGRHSGNR